MRKVIAALAGLLPSIAVAAPAEQFNLVCAGTRETISSAKAGVATEPFSNIYRVDLGKNQYCEGECREISPIAAVQPAFILLYKRESSTPNESIKSESVIDRITGKQSITYRWEARGGRLAAFRSVYTAAQCERQPFTGFPTFDTKF